MYCPTCGRENEEGSLFCEGCGAQIAPAAVSAPQAEPEPATRPAETFMPPAPPAPGTYAQAAGPGSTPGPTQPGVPYSAPLPAPARDTGMQRELYAAASAAIGISILTMCVPLLGYIAVFVAAIVFGIMGLKSGRRGLAITGIVCASIWMVGGIVFWIIYGALIMSAIGSSY